MYLTFSKNIFTVNIGKQLLHQMWLTPFAFSAVLEFIFEESLYEVSESIADISSHLAVSVCVIQSRNSTVLTGPVNINIFTTDGTARSKTMSQWIFMVTPCGIWYPPYPVKPSTCSSLFHSPSTLLQQISINSIAYPGASKTVTHLIVLYVISGNVDFVATRAISSFSSSSTRVCECVELIQDNLVEGDEFFDVVVTSPDSRVNGSRSRIIIKDDDSEKSLLYY